MKNKKGRYNNNRQKANLVLRILDDLFEEKKPETEENKLLKSGAVWHGDWGKHSDTIKFGKNSKKEHFAMILWNDFYTERNCYDFPGIRFAPITSQRKNEKYAIFLPKGELKRAKAKGGWILPKVRLIIRKSKLENKFKHIQFLDIKYVEQCKEKLQNG